MQKHKTHQIDQKAQQFLESALPATWVLNRQERDYGKDYLVEIGEADGELTGTSFYIQLKGTEQADLGKDKTAAKYYLESKHATYYADKVRDLPVFLVLIDVTSRQGWWLFLQPVLEADDKWRRQKTVLIKLPVANNLSAINEFKNNIIDSKQWIRKNHPESIYDSVIAHKEKLLRIDPRFDVKVSLVDDRPYFQFLANQTVPLRLSLSGDQNISSEKMSRLIDKGQEIEFLPGELKITGSKLFERIETEGCILQASINVPVSVSLVCLDSNSNELARLGDIPGVCTGGQKEIRFKGAYSNSPLSLNIGPISPEEPGSIKLDISLARWNGQALKRLAYFDRIYSFFSKLPKSSSTRVEFCRDGNSTKFTEIPLQNLAFSQFLCSYLATLWKARTICERLSINPIWTLESCNGETLESAEQLCAIFYGNGWVQKSPDVRLTIECQQDNFMLDILKRARKSENIRLESDCKYRFFGDHIDVGRLVHEYSAVTYKIPRKRKFAENKTNGRKPSKHGSTLKLLVVGTEKTIMRVRSADKSAGDDISKLSPLVENSLVRWGDEK